MQVYFNKKSERGKKNIISFIYFQETSLYKIKKYFKNKIYYLSYFFVIYTQTDTCSTFKIYVAIASALFFIRINL